MNYLYVQVLLKKKTTLFLLLHNNVSGSNTHESQHKQVYIYKMMIKVFSPHDGFLFRIKVKKRCLWWALTIIYWKRSVS